MESMKRLKKYLPTREELRATRTLHFLGEVIFAPNLWHFNRHSVSYACLVGVFCCFLPMPFQMVPATIMSIWIGCNMPITIALVWISNPITVPPIFYFTYRVGCWILGTPEKAEKISISLEWLTTQLAVVWKPLLLGSLVCGITFGVISFVIVRLYWRWKVRRNWHFRKLQRS
jgi:uncharacterized protein (DUF2062 family)